MAKRARREPGQVHKDLLDARNAALQCLELVRTVLHDAFENDLSGFLGAARWGGTATWESAIDRADKAIGAVAYEHLLLREASDGSPGIWSIAGANSAHEVALRLVHELTDILGYRPGRDEVESRYVTANEEPERRYGTAERIHGAMELLAYGKRSRPKKQKKVITHYTHVPGSFDAQDDDGREGAFAKLREMVEGRTVAQCDEDLSTLAHEVRKEHSHAVEARQERGSTSGKGVSLFDAAVILHDSDEELARRQVREWHNKKSVEKPPPIGKAPEHSQVDLFEPSSLAEFVEKALGRIPMGKCKYLTRLTSLAREPRQE